jgi:hypothetical protein
MTLEPVSFNAAYDDYAVYLPSLQTPYAQLPLANADAIRDGLLPAGLTLSDLNFLNPDSQLWHTKYALYSAGWFSGSQIRTPDIVSTRDKQNTVVIGDSGGFQIGKGTLAATRTWQKEAGKPNVIYNRWLNHRSIREQMLRWLDTYCDYAMTLDMPLWAMNNKQSPFRKLSAQQLIDLSVENLRFFEANAGKATGAKAKYLNVLQDVGHGTGDAWYKAVTPFKFTSGWALGSATKKNLDNILYWIKRLLDDGHLGRCEWIHVLGTSSLQTAVYLTAIQRELRKLTGNHNLKISYDSSSPFQHAGKRKLVACMPTLTSDIKSWTIPTIEFPQNPKHVNSTARTYLTQALSPVMQRVSIEEFMVEKGAMSRNFFDRFSEQLLINHNMFVYHQATMKACDSCFSHEPNDATLPPEIFINLNRIRDINNSL